MELKIPKKYWAFKTFNLFLIAITISLFTPDLVISIDSNFANSAKTNFIPDQNSYSILDSNSKQNFVDLEPRQETPAKRRRIPGFPRDPPLPSINITNIITLVEMAGNDTEIDDETEALLVQTLKEILTFIGLQDTGDLMGMFLMYFVMAPILVPLFWMPIAMLALGFLVIPIIYKAPLITPLAAGRENNQFNYNNSSECLEMISCELNNFLRASRWSSWISRTFNLTKVEWAGKTSKKKSRRSSKNSRYLEHEDCNKYSCTFVRPAQRFFGNWYSYLFTYRKTLNNI